jgi:glycosyltransferase involved in cell wall biosynthesis
MTATDPLISVIVPCYNHGEFLNETLQSVYGQVYTQWECLIIDDGSSDNTEEVALAWQEKDQRFKYFYKKNEGLSSARNKGLDEARGDYIQFLDADDLIDRYKFNDSIKRGNGADAIMSGFKMFTTDNRELANPPFVLDDNHFNFESILLGWDDQFVFPPHCGIFKTSLFDKLRFNESLSAKEDWVMWLQIYRQGIKSVFLAKPYALYRLSTNSMSRNKSLMDKNLVIAFKIIYEMLPAEYREMFFNKAVDSLSNLITDYEDILAKTRQSESYRLGNFIVRHFNKIRKTR